VSVLDGQPSPRPTYAPYPFNRVDEEFRVEFGGDAITVSDADGISVTYPAAFYRLG
jgi:hypothetical protein